MHALLLSADTALTVPVWAWVGFLVFIAVMLALDLGVFSSTERAPSFKEAVGWCGVWIGLAVAFGFFLSHWHGSETAELFAAGYVLELALSVDNLFIFILVFAHFKIPGHLQHRVLFWGIIGAVVMRAIFIIAGVAAVDRFTFLLPLFGVFLIFTGFKLAFAKDEEHGKGVDEQFAVRMVRKFFPVTNQLHGKAFWIIEHGKRVFTPLFIVLVVIEFTDLIFAIDSIPAVLGILPAGMSAEERRFIAFTSNIFAILGLRSMYFAIAGFMQYFRFLRPALAIILGFIGLKMLLPWVDSLSTTESLLGAWLPASFFAQGKFHVPTQVSLSIIGVVLATAIALSVAFPKKK
ncbi:TerC/Alx family metal homeostasis membrane protein [bacterium]|nr:TerC/Alx family metal homeostasis membrane protein [bacterium]